MHVRRQSPESPLEVLTVAWPFLAGMLLMLMISIGSIYALSAMRAYVTGLAIWVSAEGDANAGHRWSAPMDAKRVSCKDKGKTE